MRVLIVLLCAMGLATAGYCQSSYMSKPPKAPPYVSPVSPVVTYRSLYAAQSGYAESIKTIQQQVANLEEAIDDLAITKPRSANASQLMLTVFVNDMNAKQPDFGDADIRQLCLEYLAGLRTLVRSHHQ